MTELLLIQLCAIMSCDSFT